MQVSAAEWSITLVVTLTVLAVDVAIVARRPREPRTAYCVAALAGYIGLALAFGAWVWHAHGSAYGIQFLAGWLTEYSLSVDNLFVFLLIMASFKVPRQYQQEALLIGIVLALILRGIFIMIGGIAIQRLSWVFYIFGAFLLFTAFRMTQHFEADEAENRIVRFARAHLNTTDGWGGLKLVVRHNGKWAMTPMFLVALALGTTDLIFALDSIPALYGLTSEPYLVFAANVFALMGLRQLYFLLGKALERLVYLPHGLAVVLGFIAVKMVLHALHTNDLPFINGGQPVPVPEIHTEVSLAVIAVTIILTTLASLYKTRGVSDPTL